MVTVRNPRHDTQATGPKIFAGRRAPPGEGMQRRSASAAVLEIAVRTARRRRARRVGPAFASSIPVGADEPVRVARQIYGRGRGRLMSHGLRQCRRRQQRGATPAADRITFRFVLMMNLMCVSGFSPGFRQLCDIPHRTRDRSVTGPSRNCAGKFRYYSNLRQHHVRFVPHLRAAKDS